MVLLNTIVALSNFTVFIPLLIALQNGDLHTYYAVLFVGLASFVSHLFENHKHGMSGIPCLTNSTLFSYVLNRFDVLGCLIVIIRFAYIYYEIYGITIYPLVNNRNNLLIKIGVSFCLNIISEYDKYNPKLKYVYIVTHCIWHVTIFYLMGEFLTELIY
jgi:hypothetical protein